MLNRYFNFLRINDEYTFIDPILDHTRFDDEELVLLGDMIEKCQTEKSEELQTIYDSIQKIRTKSHKEFEMLSDQIVNSNFDQQKQHDILRIHSRIENISGLIFATSKRLLIAMKINCHIPNEVRPHIYELWQLVLNMHRSYIRVVELYTQSSKEIMDAIHTVQDEENYIDHFKSECLIHFYNYANTNNIPIGNFTLIREIIDHLEDIADAIESASTGFNWLLIK